MAVLSAASCIISRKLVSAACFAISFMVSKLSSVNSTNAAFAGLGSDGYEHWLPRFAARRLQAAEIRTGISLADIGSLFFRPFDHHTDKDISVIPVNRTGCELFDRHHAAVVQLYISVRASRQVRISENPETGIYASAYSCAVAHLNLYDMSGALLKCLRNMYSVLHEFPTVSGCT